LGDGQRRPTHEEQQVNREAQADAGGFLSGVRVLELADELGEYCGKVLAGLGADVIKVEPLGGEVTRSYGPFAGDDPHPDKSLYFWHYNFGKRGVTVDLESEHGRDQLARLIKTADVVLETRPRRYLEERGLGYDAMSKIDAGVIYARITPFGDDGPWADYRGSDLVHLALGGVVMNCGYDPTPTGEYDLPPVAPQMWQSYHIAGETTAMSIVAALCYRLQTGRGQALSTAVHDVVAKNTETDLPDWVYRRAPHYRATCRHSFPSNSSSSAQNLPATPGIVMSKDGRWVLPYQSYLPGVGSPLGGLLTMLAEHGYGEEVSGKEFEDPDYVRQAAGIRRTNAIVSRLVGGYTFDRHLWLEAQERGLPWAPVRKPEENADDRHWAQRRSFVRLPDRESGRMITHIGAKWVSPDVPWRCGPQAPLLGEHNDEVIQHPEDRPRFPDLVDTTRHDARGSDASRWGKPWALGGVRVVDLGWILASAGGGRFLAALGAEVIKVEHSSKIDMQRIGGGFVPEGLRAERDAATEPVPSKPTSGLNRTGGFMENNTGKRAISLNLKSERGREILKKLIAEADVLVEGYSPGTMERMGLGYDVLRALNPRLVYVQQSGMGQVGVYGRLKSFGPTAQAMSGLSEMSGLPEPAPPAGIGYSYLDWFGAYQIALAMTAGLFRQKTTGRGCWIDSSQVEAGIYLSGTAVLDHSVNGRSWSRYGNRSPYKVAAPHGIYRVRGVDRWIAIAAFDQADWIQVIRVLGAHELADDERFATLPLRMANADLLDAAINGETQKWDGVELMTALQSAGVAAGICESTEDRCEWDPQLRHLQWLVEFQQTEIGSWRAKTPPTRFSHTPPYQGGLPDRHGPNYGEDNDYVYREILRMSSEEIDDLVRDGVI
jgi:crotonobetainyl-CoA:carnitine CoA-transferase CaiB-like acyl-CoA transferase